MVDADVPAWHFGVGSKRRVSPSTAPTAGWQQYRAGVNLRSNRSYASRAGRFFCVCLPTRMGKKSDIHGPQAHEEDTNRSHSRSQDKKEGEPQNSPQNPNLSVNPNLTVNVEKPQSSKDMSHKQSEGNTISSTGKLSSRVLYSTNPQPDEELEKFSDHRSSGDSTAAESDLDMSPYLPKQGVF